MVPRIAIIGGGWSGLAAAVTLADAGVSCTLFEAAKQLGGRARRVVVNDEVIDNGQHILLGAYSETLRVLRLVNEHADSLLVRQPLTVVRPGGLHIKAPRLPAPFHLLLALLKARGLTIADRVAAIKFFAALKRKKFRVLAGVTVGQLLEGQPRILVEQLWEPLCVAALNTPMAQASAQTFLNVLHTVWSGTGAMSDFLLPRSNLQELFPNPARVFMQARKGELRLGEAVTAMHTADRDTYCLSLRERRENYSDVICAVAPQHFSRLTVGLPTLLPLRRAIDRFVYQPIATVYLRCDAWLRLPEPILQLDGNPGQWLFDRAQLGGKPALYAVVISAAASERGAEQDELIDDVVEQLRRTWPEWPRLKWAKVIMEKRATFACTPNLVRPEAGRVMQGFYLAGDYTDPEFPATIEAAVRTGVRAAQALLADLD